MDPASLTMILAPFLPALIKGGQDLVEEAVKGFGEDAWRQVKGLWAKLRPKVEQDPVASKMSAALADRPDDARARGGFELQLEEILKSDPALVSELSGLWKQAESTGVIAAIGERSVALRDANNVTIITGNVGSGGGTGEREV